LDLLASAGTGENEACQAVVTNIPADLEAWTAAGDPVQALGEYWSARLFAIQTGRTFVDARELIAFDIDGQFNELWTTANIQSRLHADERYVVPGFYGRSADGHVQVFPRGGSDITGAIIAKVLNARRYDNWSNVPGFMTADPRKVDPEVDPARLLDKSTYRESREMNNGGTELLHRAVISHLNGTGIPTIMRNTFGEPGNYGTEIVDTLDSWQERPVMAVTGRDDILALTLHQFGLNEEVGATAFLYDALKDAAVSYEHAATATDDIALYIPGFKENLAAVQGIIRALERTGRTFNVQQVGLLHVVGEGLAKSNILRLRTLGRVATALADEGIEGLGGTDVASSATLTIFVRPEAVPHAIRTVHRALGLSALANR